MFNLYCDESSDSLGETPLETSNDLPNSDSGEPCLETHKEIFRFISKHRPFFQASFTGALDQWVAKNLLKTEKDQLKSFSDELNETLLAPHTLDVRKSNSYDFVWEFPDALACFIDGITGLDSPERNPEIGESRDCVLLAFLKINNQVSETLAYGLPKIEDIIARWEESQKQLDSQTKSNHTSTSPCKNNSKQEVKSPQIPKGFIPLRDITKPEKNRVKNNITITMFGNREGVEKHKKRSQPTPKHITGKRSTASPKRVKLTLS